MSKKRFRRDGINWKKVIFIYIVFSFLLYRLTIFLFTTDYLSLREVIIEGTKVLKPKYIVELGRIKPGTNLLLLNTYEIKKNIKKNPWVEDVIIKKKFFHSVFIIIKERTPYCILYNGKDGVVLNNRCIALTKNIDSFSFLRKIIWKKFDISKVFLGKDIENKQVCDSIYIMRLFDQEFSGILKKVEIKGINYINLYTKYNLMITISSIDDLTEKKKFVMLKKILKTKAKDLKILDLRYKKGIIGK